MDEQHDCPGRVYNVRDFGAAGDGQTFDTVAIQRAIDVCAAAAGGVVFLHNGTFLAGSLILKSHVTLHLSSTATLLGSPNIDDYYLDAKFTYCGGLLSHAFLYAEECDSIAITGQGTIHGNGRADWRSSKPRPMLIRLRRCARVLVRDVKLVDFPAWGLHPIECTDLRIEGITIHSYVQSNNDGIDLEGCEQVFISNCNIYSGDDSIAFKTVNPDRPCRDIVVTNCVISSGCAAIRLGPETKAAHERIAVSNCVIRDTGLNGIKLQVSHGAAMRDIVFSNIVMDNVTGPISIRLGGWDPGSKFPGPDLDDAGWEKGVIENVLFENIRARVSPRYMAGTPQASLEIQGTEKSCISIMGTPQTKPAGLTFSNIHVTFPGGGTKEEADRREIPELPRQYPEMFMFGVLPAYAFFARHASRIVLRNVRFELAAVDLRPAIVCDDVEDLELVGVKADGHPQAESLIRLNDTRNALIAETRLRGNGRALLQIEGAQSQGIVLSAHPPALAAKPVVMTRRAPAEAVVYL